MKKTKKKQPRRVPPVYEYEVRSGSNPFGEYDHQKSFEGRNIKEVMLVAMFDYLGLEIVKKGLAK